MNTSASRACASAAALCPPRPRPRRLRHRLHPTPPPPLCRTTPGIILQAAGITDNTANTEDANNPPSGCVFGSAEGRQSGRALYGCASSNTALSWKLITAGMSWDGQFLLTPRAPPAYPHRQNHRRRRCRNHRLSRYALRIPPRMPPGSNPRSPAASSPPPRSLPPTKYARGEVTISPSSATLHNATQR